MKTLVLVEVEGGMVVDVKHAGNLVEYHVVDWDMAEVGEEIEELPEEFAKLFPETAEEIKDRNADLVAA